MYTVSVLARGFGLSRSALLYYDRIGLLCPSARSHTGYRLYNEADKARLERICLLRQAGVPLEQIQGLLDESVPPSQEAHAALASHLHDLCLQIETLRHQQARVVRLMFSDPIQQARKALDRTQLVELLRGAGLEEEDLRQWHVLFEQTNPHEHRAFLLGLGMSRAEIEALLASIKPLPSGAPDAR